MKSKKGITLIALIITIIVMLILVGVTINVALNGGLFEKAKDAKQKTSREVAREELLSIVTGTLNNTGDLQITPTNLAKDEWTAEQSENENYLKCTSPKDEIFYVSIETGAILDKLPSEPKDTYYNISFKDLSGVDLLSIFPEKNLYGIVFTNKDGINSAIQIVPDGQNRGIMFMPDVTVNAWYMCRYYSSTQEISSWEYEDYQEQSSEQKNPPELKNVTIDYTAGSSNGISDFTETMLKNIANVTEVK